MGSSPSESTRLDIFSGNVIPTTPTTITQVLKKIPSSILLLSALILSICLVSRAQQSSNSDSFSSINASKSLTTSSHHHPNHHPKFHVNFLVSTSDFELTRLKMIYNGSGCGRNNRGCTCQNNGNGDLQMSGFGPHTHLFIGLSFACNFQVDASACSVSVNMPVFGTNSIVCSCTGGYYISDCNIGKREYQTNLKMQVRKL